MWWCGEGLINVMCCVLCVNLIVVWAGNSLFVCFLCAGCVLGEWVSAGHLRLCSLHEMSGRPERSYL